MAHAPKLPEGHQVLIFVSIALCRGAPTPGPNPKPSVSQELKPYSSLLLTSEPAIVTAPVLSYSHYFTSPVYDNYQPYIYNLGYASAYSYNSYPYYVPVHLI